MEDDRPGIPGAERERAFERFHCRDAKRDTEGSGLGLAIVRTFSDHRGARVALTDDAEGRGLRADTTFLSNSGPQGHPLVSIRTIGRRAQQLGIARPADLPAR